MLFRTTLSAVVLAAGSLALSAQTVPSTINYQGRLTDNTPSQTPLNATIPMQFAIYDAPSGGNKLWQEPASGGTAVTVTGGVFTVMLGSNGVALPASVFSGGTQRYLEIILNPGASQEILAPRQRIGAVPYAQVAPAATGAIQSGLQFGYTLPNGSGFETSSNQWMRAGTFLFRGTGVEKTPTALYAMLYTTNSSTWYRVRLFDVTNFTLISISTPGNMGTLSAPAVVSLGALSNLPVNPAVFEIQILATDSTGNTGISGRQVVGIHSFQMY